MLEGLIPEAALERIAWACSEEDIRLRIVRGRATKTGDFRPPRNGKVCIITVNGNMNPYASMITIVHELAHYQVYRSQLASFNPFKKYRRSYTPHGKEWKATFRALMFEYMTEEIFPAPVLDALMIYMEHPTASTFSNHKLLRALSVYDTSSGLVTIESLPEGAIFKTTTGRTFRKLEKRRTRYLCYCLDNRQKYTFSPIVQVIPEETPEVTNL
jgi:hypothetical protein